MPKKLPAFPPNARVLPNDPATVEELSYDADGEFVGSSLHPLSDYDPETVPAPLVETNIGGFVQIPGDGWTEEQLAEKAASAAKGTEDKEEA